MNERNREHFSISQKTGKAEKERTQLQIFLDIDINGKEQGENERGCKYFFTYRKTTKTEV